MSEIKARPLVEISQSAINCSNVNTMRSPTKFNISGIKARPRIDVSQLDMKSPTNLNISGQKRNAQAEGRAQSKKTRPDCDSSTQTVTLNSGQEMPIVQFGTYKMKGEDCYKAVVAALRVGYMGLDTASVYDNEKEVGRAVMDSGVDREKLFIQTKLWRSFVGPAKNGKPKCDSELRKSLKKLGVKMVDIWLMHWPGPGRHLNYPPVKVGMERPKVEKLENKDKMVPLNWSPAMRLDTYKEMAKFVGKEVGALGVCNFSARQLTQLLEFCSANNLPRPAVVQNEFHPLLLAKEVRALCEKEGIVFQAYASLGAGALGLLDNPVVKNIASNLGVSAAQVLLRWGMQHGCTLLPKSSKEERMRTNMDIWSFKLGKEEMDELNSLDMSKEGQNTMAGWLREQDPDYY